MDLLTAKQEAAKESKAHKKTTYVYVDGDGECDISFSADSKAEVLHAFNNGKEIPLELPAKKADKKKKTTTEEPVVVTEEATAVSNNQASSTKTKTNKVMATATKTAKKSTKKVAAKKSTPAKTAKTAVKIEGKKKTTTVKEVLAWVKKGNRAYNKDGKPLPEGYLARMADPAREIEVTLVEIK